MAISLVAIGQEITAYIANLIIAQTNAQMGTAVVPTSVAGTGVTVSANGKVSAVNSPSISLNGIFTSTYDTYKIIFDCSATSTSAGGTIRLRLAGTDNSTAIYGFEQVSNAAAVVTATSSATATAWNLTAVAGTEHFAEITINAPALARATRAKLDTGTWTANVINTKTISELRHSLTSAFDGITFIASAGNFTAATVTVYGYNTNA